jgi:hypothetical protein
VESVEVLDENAQHPSLSPQNIPSGGTSSNNSNAFPLMADFLFAFSTTNFA